VWLQALAPSTVAAWWTGEALSGGCRHDSGVAPVSGKHCLKLQSSTSSFTSWHYNDWHLGYGSTPQLTARDIVQPTNTNYDYCFQTMLHRAVRKSIVHIANVHRHENGQVVSVVVAAGKAVPYKPPLLQPSCAFTRRVHVVTHTLLSRASASLRDMLLRPQQQCVVQRLFKCNTTLRNTPTHVLRTSLRNVNGRTVTSIGHCKGARASVSLLRLEAHVGGSSTV
jgi:hypothetical protein